MQRTSALALVTIATLVLGCSAEPAPIGVQPTPQVVYVTPETGAAASAVTPEPAAAAPVVTPAPSPSPEPTPELAPDPEALRAAAATQYLAAATKANNGTKALNKKYPKTFKTLKQARRYWKADAKIEGTFLAEIKAIQVPPDTVADMRDLIRKAAAVQAIELEAAHASNWSQLRSARGAMDKIWRRSSAAANLVRSDLGLPPVYS